MKYVFFHIYSHSSHSIFYLLQDDYIFISWVPLNVKVPPQNAQENHNVYPYEVFLEPMVTLWARDLDYRLAIGWFRRIPDVNSPNVFRGFGEFQSAKRPIKTFRDPKRIFYTTQIMTLMTPCSLSGLPTAPAGWMGCWFKPQNWIKLG